MFLSFINSGSVFSTSPTKNSLFSKLFIFAFSFASSIACSTVSIPYNFLTFLEAKIPIVPIPQYKSYTVSLPVNPSYSTALLYNFSV